MNTEYMYSQYRSRLQGREKGLFAALLTNRTIQGTTGKGPKEGVKRLSLTLKSPIQLTAVIVFSCAYHAPCIKARLVFRRCNEYSEKPAFLAMVSTSLNRRDIITGEGIVNTSFSPSS